MRRILALTLLGVACVAALSLEAHARGGRFSGPAGTTPRSPEDPAPPDTAPATPDCPAPEPSTPTVPLAGIPETAAPTMGAGRRIRVARAPGIGDWVYWYEANREQFEDLRATLFVTEANPLFAVGAAAGKRVGTSERRLDRLTMRTLRAALQAVLTGERDEHWNHTAGAATIALGKIASDDTDIELILRPLVEGSEATAYVRESAVLALGQLRRTASRRQLPGTTLDRVRRILFEVFEDGRAADRTRAFAALSLGLLSDQPSSQDMAGAATARRLFHLWWSTDLADETQIGVLVAFGLHRPATFPATLRAALQRVVRDGTAGGRVWTAAVRAQAAVALGRVGSPVDARVIAATLEQRAGTSPALGQGAVLAAGLLAERHPVSRVALAKALVGSQRTLKDPTSRAQGWIALGRILAADAQDGTSTVLRTLERSRPLRTAVREAQHDERAYAALGLALALRQVDAELTDAVWQALRSDGLEALRAGLKDRNVDAHTRAAFALALGLARDAGGVDPLLAQVRNADADPELRAYAALGLGLLGRTDRAIVRAVTDAFRDARSDRLRMQAATALGLLGGGSVKDRERSLATLLEGLAATRNRHVKGRIAITLARIGDGRAVMPLRRVLRTREEQPMSRAIACAALGLLGDEETTPVLAAARRDAHYLAGSSVILEILDVL